MIVGSKSNIQRLLQSDETMATVINVIMMSSYGEEAYDWDPLTVALELKDDYEVDVSAGIMDKWCAIQTVMGSDTVFRRIDAFSAVCNTLSSGQPFFSVFDPVEPEEAAWGLTEIAINRDMLPLSNTIERYILKSLERDGYTGNIPPVFRKFMDVPEINNTGYSSDESIVAANNAVNITGYINGNIKDIKYQLSLLSGDEIDVSGVYDSIEKAVKTHV